MESISQARRGTNWPLARVSKLDQESIKEKKKKLYYALDLVSYTHALVLFCHLLVSILIPSVKTLYCFFLSDGVLG